MTKSAWRRLTFALPFVPLGTGLIATALYFAQGGFGGGAGDLDWPIAALGLPAVALHLTRLPIPGFIERSDLLAVIWFPAVLNTVLFWSPLAYFLFRAGRLQIRD